MASTWHPTGKKTNYWGRVVQATRSGGPALWRPTGKKPAAPKVVQAIRPPGV